MTVSQISSIEKAFGLSSKESGWLLTIWEVGYVVCTVIVSYFGPRVHIARAIGVATIACGVSAFVFALPHFVAFTDKIVYSANLNSNDSTQWSAPEPRDINLDKLCIATNNSDVELPMNSPSQAPPTPHKVPGSSKVLAYALFNAAMLLQGVSKAPCYPYSAQYIDDVDQKKTGFYVGTKIPKT